MNKWIKLYVVLVIMNVTCLSVTGFRPSKINCSGLTLDLNGFMAKSMSGIEVSALKSESLYYGMVTLLWQARVCPV